MYTILNNEEYKTVISKSRFISYIYKVESLEDIKIVLEDLKTLYNDASHICYAYKINEKEYANDDNEPNNTAGLPILKAILKSNLNLVLIVVIRYFGGIKLGTGGLIKAYRDSSFNVIKKCTLKEIKSYYEVYITIPYEEVKKLDYLLNNSIILNKEFNEVVLYKVLILKSEIDNFKNYNYEIKKEVIY